LYRRCGGGVFDLERVEEGVAGTRFAGWVRHFVSVDSTNRMAVDAAQAGADGGVWVADEQTAGRGRGGHTWHSAAGDGLYCSALVRLGVPAELGLWVSLATGLAAQAGIEAAGGPKIDIRWPNDLMLGGKKCGGILVESAIAVESGRLRYAAIGVGINVNHAGFPDELAGVATSLRIACGRTLAREEVLVGLLRALDREIAGLEAGGEGLLARFAEASSWVRGREVRVEEAGGYTGVTCGLDERGFLRVKDEAGEVRTVLSGGVRGRKEYPGG
jgi:BirA family biotin operon repressor/biotin-[acetyl-CoA-carboxylase] ligase